METTLKASIVSSETVKVGDLIYTSELMSPALCLVIAEMDGNRQTATIVLNPSEGLPYMFHLDEGDEVLSFGSDWLLKPVFSMTDCNQATNWRRHHLVIARGGLQFQVRGEGVTNWPIFVPVDGQARDEPAKRRLAPIICRGYEIYSSREAMEQGDPPIHLVDQSDLLGE